MTVARTLVITYGSYTAAQPDNTDAGYRYHEGFEDGWCEFDFVLTAADAAALKVLTDAAADAFRTPRQKFTLAVGGSTLISWDPATTINTGFDAESSLEKIGDPWDSGTSQKMMGRVAVGLPADKNSLAGRRESTVTLQYGGSRRRELTIEGTYTAITTNQATDQYAAQIAAYVTTVQAATGGTWRLIFEDTPYFETDKTIRFVRRYEEIVATQFDSTGREQRTSITISRDGLGDSEGPKNEAILRMATITANLSASIDKDDSTNLAAKFTAARAYLLGRVQALTPETALGLVRDDPVYNEDDNAITLSQVYHAALGAGWREYTREEVPDYNPANILLPTWSSVRWHRYLYTGRETMTLTITEIGTFVGSYDRTPKLESDVTPLTPPPDGAEWIYTGSSRPHIRRLKGVDSVTYDEYEVRRVHRFEAGAVTVAAGGGA